LKSPPTDKLLATRVYRGPSVATCGNPVFTYTHSTTGALIPFLIPSFDAATSNVSITMDEASVIKGNYTVNATFTLPGVGGSWKTGVTLRVLNSCDTSTFPSAPTFTPNGTNYYYGTGNLAITVAYA